MHQDKSQQRDHKQRKEHHRHAFQQKFRHESFFSFPLFRMLPQLIFVTCLLITLL